MRASRGKLPCVGSGTWPRQKLVGPGDGAVESSNRPPSARDRIGRYHVTPISSGCTLTYSAPGQYGGVGEGGQKD